MVANDREELPFFKNFILKNQLQKSCNRVVELGIVTNETPNLEQAIYC